jgi:hypothetical protein
VKYYAKIKGEPPPTGEWIEACIDAFPEDEIYMWEICRLFEVEVDGCDHDLSFIHIYPKRVKFIREVAYDSVKFALEIAELNERRNAMMEESMLDYYKYKMETMRKENNRILVKYLREC